MLAICWWFRHFCDKNDGTTGIINDRSGTVVEGQQFGVATGGYGVDRHDPFAGEARQVVGGGPGATPAKTACTCRFFQQENLLFPMSVLQSRQR